MNYEVWFGNGDGSWHFPPRNLEFADDYEALNWANARSFYLIRITREDGTLVAATDGKGATTAIDVRGEA